MTSIKKNIAQKQTLLEREKKNLPQELGKKTVLTKVLWRKKKLNKLMQIIIET